MTTQLPTSVNFSVNKSSKGFTLVELLVVIAILAILGTIAMAVFSNTQKTARDARRKEDINSIAQALEANKTQNSPTYNVLATSMFTSGSIPTDTTTAQYCAATSTTSTAPAAPAAWLETAACPTGYAAVSATNPAATTVSWTVCARMEGATFVKFCKSNSQ